MLPKVSIIIVNYNTGKLLYNCLDSIRKYVNLDYEVFVADNKSDDDSVARCREFWENDAFSLLQMEKNIGFAKANNVAAAKATGKIFHFLNPDTELSLGITQDYLQAMLHAECVYVNPLVNGNGSLENDRMPIPVLKNIKLWNAGSEDAEYWYKGASVIISAENFRRIGGWCEEYFLFAEDLDLFYELWRHHIPILDARTRIFHLGGGSTSSRWSALRREIQVEKSNRIFFKRHFSFIEYAKSKFYYFVHHMAKRPEYVPRYLAAWFLSLWC